MSSTETPVVTVGPDGPRGSSGAPTLLPIGELAERTGVTTAALRYYDELGLVRPAARAAGRRCYAESAVAQVGLLLFLREVGFSLAEIGSLVASKRPAVVEGTHRPQVGRTGRAAAPCRRGTRRA